MSVHNRFCKGVALAICATGIPLFTSAASAQMVNSPWGFKPQNRASIAALIRQVENPEDGSSASGSVTNLVCGSDAGSSAKGNGTCVIMNNSTGNIDIRQDSQGNQTSTSTVSQTQHQSAADDILNTLEGR